MGAGAGAPVLGLDMDVDIDGSRDDGCIRGGYGELGNGRLLNVNGVVSAGPTLPPEVLASAPMRGDGRLNAAAEMVRVPGGGAAGLVDGPPVEGDNFPSGVGRKGDSAERLGDSIGVR